MVMASASCCPQKVTQRQSKSREPNMAQRVDALAHRPLNRGLIPRVHMAKEKNLNPVYCSLTFRLTS